MDVRCEKCGTEYELDETRLKPGGVTVKCTSCGHMFKIRKRASTNVGVPAVSIPPAASAPRPGSVSGSPDSGPTGGERNWIIRMANGEQRTCRELATLQQWIVQGLVKRDSMISRSGKTWKQLGDIPELAQFFGVAEEATRTRRDSGRITSPQQPQRARESRPVPDVATTTLGLGAVGAPPEQARARPRTQPPPPPKALAGHAGPMAPLPSLGGAPANDAKPKAPAPAASSSKATVPAVPPRMPGPSVPVVAPQPASKPITFSRPAASPSSSPVPQVPALGGKPGAPQRSTGAWATEDVRPMEASAGADSFRGLARTDAAADVGFSGQVRPVPTHDAAFIGSSRAGMPRATRTSGSFTELSPSEIIDDETGPVVPRRAGGGLGKWIAVGSLALIAGAAAAIYFIVVRQPDKKTDASVVAVPRDGGVATAIDGGATDPTPDPVGDDAIANARDALLIDSGPALTAAAKALADAPEDPIVDALRARLITALAQGAQDEAAFRDGKAAAALAKQAKKSVAEAMPLAQKAVKTASRSPAGDDAMGHVAMADVLRLQGKPTKDVRAQLDRALQIAPNDPEARLVEALLAERDGKPADAKAIYTKLEADNPLSGSGDVRPKLRLALLAYAANDAPGAQQHAEDVIAVQADHTVAALLLAKLRDTVASGDPMPPEEDIDAGVKAGSGTSSGSGTGTGTSSGSGSGTSKGTSSGHSSEPSGDYDALLAKADRLAESNCDEAMPYYAKALELKPNGVAALTGRGYCYIDAKSFSSAHSSFRAALAVSRKYEPALWGIAEAYQQQGLKDKAIEAYQDYLETYPGSSKALKQLERLGVSSTDGGGDDPPKDPDPPKEDPPADPPAEDPAPSDG